jgi:hypothetical protein
LFSFGSDNRSTLSKLFISLFLTSSKAVGFLKFINFLAFY